MKIKPLGTKVCSVCGSADLDMTGFNASPMLSEHVVMKKHTTQIMTIVNPKQLRNSSKMTSLF